MQHRTKKGPSRSGALSSHFVPNDVEIDWAPTQIVRNAMAYAIQYKQYYLYDYPECSDHNEYELDACSKSGLSFIDQLLVLSDYAAMGELRRTVAKSKK